MRHNKALQYILEVLQSNATAPDSTLAFNDLFKLAIRHRICQQLLTALIPFQTQFLPTDYDRLSRYCRQDALRLLQMAAAMTTLSKTLTSEHITHCFVKGLAISTILYGDIAQRTCKDIDVWISRAHLSQAITCLCSLGYRQTLPTYELEGHQANYYMNHRHDIEFYHREHNVCVELHFRLDYFGLQFGVPNSDYFQTIQMGSTPIVTLQDDYHLLYLMIHGAIHAWIRLRWLQDIALYIQSGRCDLTRVFILSQRIHCEHVVEQALLLVQTHFNNKPLPYTPSPRAKALARTAATFIASNYEMTPEYGVFNPLFVKYRLYLIRLASKGQKLKALLGDLFKIDNLFPYVKLPAACAFLYYLLYPFWVVKRAFFR